MRRVAIVFLAALVILAFLVMVAGGCALRMGSFESELGGRNRPAAVVDQRLVEAFVRAGNLAGARAYMLRLKLTEAEILARIQAARDALAEGVTNVP